MRPTRAQRALWNHRSKIIERIKAQNMRLGTELEAIRLDWYRVRNAAGDDGDTAELLIYDEIGGLCGIPADELVQEIGDIKAKNLDVRINSPGGSLFDSIAIYNALVRKSRTTNVTTYVDALAASGASIIAMAGNQCVMMVGSQLMIHDAIGMEYGNAESFREMAKFLDNQSWNIADVYTAKAGGERDQWRALMQAETWMFAQEAVDLRLADSVYVRPDSSGPEIEMEDPPVDVDGEEPPEDLEDGCGKDGKKQDEDSSSMTEDEELDALLHMPHRLNNRGYRYLGRNRAPSPVNHDWFSQAELASLLK